MSFETFNWVGSAMLMVASIPQAYMSFKQGHSDGVSRMMLWLWFFGMMSCLVFFASISIWPTVTNYIFNLFVAGTILRYSYFPLEKKSSFS